MKRTHYYFDLFAPANRKKSRKVEEILRKFLLNNADTVRLTRVYYVEGLFFRKTMAANDNPKVKTALATLAKFLKKKITNNKRFNDLPQGRGKKFHHYFYKLAPIVKKLLNSETLFWPYIPPYSRHFYGFEDPTFYSGGKMIAAIFTNENGAMLYLTKIEKEKLVKQGLVLDLIANQQT